MLTKYNGQNDCEIDPPELSKAERLDMAVQAWHAANGALSYEKAAKKHGVNYSTVRNRCKGAVSKKEANQAKQRLSVAEEEAIRKWVLQLGAWGWPPLVSQLNKSKKGVPKLYKNWAQYFLHRHPDLRSRFVPPSIKNDLSQQILEGLRDISSASEPSKRST